MAHKAKDRASAPSTHKSPHAIMAQALAKATPVAVIDEQVCIGCTLCIEACPVDAIVGAARLMHTVIAAECTGCRLCLPPCPVDCIAMTETGETWTHEERLRRASQYRRRHEARTERLERERAADLAMRRDQAGGRRKQATIERVMQRARDRLRNRQD
jgi:electron transport complex protein RnfB